LEDASKSNKETPEVSDEEAEDESVEESQPEPETKETPEEVKEEPEETEEIEEEPPEEQDIEEEPEEASEEAKEEAAEAKEEKPAKPEVKKEEPKKRPDRGPDFKYIVRLSNTDVDGEKNVVYGLTSIKGIGLHMATLIADETGVDRYSKIGDLTDAQIEKLQEVINNVNKNAPGWMLNHRKDYETGKDIHLISSEIDMRLRDEINIMKKIRSYRGIRHERGLPVRGQRTRANNRRGLALGVSKKREIVAENNK